MSKGKNIEKLFSRGIKAAHISGGITAYSSVMQMMDNNPSLTHAELKAVILDVMNRLRADNERLAVEHEIERVTEPELVTSCCNADSAYMDGTDCRCLSCGATDIELIQN